MLNIIEGANFVGKTTTLEEMKKKRKDLIFIYHPRFNDNEYYDFEYYRKSHVGLFVPINMPIHRDIVYQISHTTCLKYLKSFKEKNIVLDRVFISEMVYNEYIDTKFYEQLVEILKRDFDYKIYFLTCDDDTELEKRIIARSEADAKKGYGVRLEDASDPDSVVEKFHTQKKLTSRFLNIFDTYQLKYMKIDTSHIFQKEVAGTIIEDMFPKKVKA
jgi:hypothetical protein